MCFLQYYTMYTEGRLDVMFRVPEKTCTLKNSVKTMEHKSSMNDPSDT